MFAGGELPVRLICRPYFCRWKIASLGLPVTNCQTLKFPVVLFPVTAIYQWQIAAECYCHWYICQCKAMAFLEPRNLLLCSYLLNVGPYLRNQGSLKDPRTESLGPEGPIKLKTKSSKDPVNSSLNFLEFEPNLEPLKLDHIDQVLDPKDHLGAFWGFRGPRFPPIKNLGLIGPN